MQNLNFVEPSSLIVRRSQAFVHGVVEFAVADSHRHLVHPILYCDRAGKPATLFWRVAEGVLKRVVFLLVNWDS